MKRLVLLLMLGLLTGAPDSSNQSHGRRLTKQRVESLLGKRCPDIIRREGQYCYATSDPDVIAFVEFNEADEVEKLSLSACLMRIEHLDTIALKIVPENFRGKHIDRIAKSKPTGCFTSYKEDYERVTVSYSESGCTNCNHPRLTITWKRQP